MNELSIESLATADFPATPAGENRFLVLTASDIVCAYVANNQVPSADLPALIETVFKAVRAQVSGEPVKAPAEKLVPAVPVDQSVQDTQIICLEDGKGFKSLKRHLREQYGMTPEQYRTKWGLPADYPMVAPEYSKRRAAMAKDIGLGRKKADVAVRAAA